MKKKDEGLIDEDRKGMINDEKADEKIENDEKKKKSIR